MSLISDLYGMALMIEILTYRLVINLI